MKSSWIFRSALLLIFAWGSVVITLASVRSQDGVWEHVDKAQLRQPGIDSLGLPNAYEAFRLDKASLQYLLDGAPNEFTGQPVILSLPMPDGTFGRFQIEHSPIVEDGLLVNYPELGATYRGYGLDDRTASVRFDFLPTGFHSMILSASGTVIVDPASASDTVNYISYFKKDRPRTGSFECFFENGDRGFESIVKVAEPGEYEFMSGSAPEVISGAQLRTYRLALGANVEYCSAVGGNTVAGCLAASVLIMNRVNGVYERDVALRMVLVGNNNLVTFAADNLTCGAGMNQACTTANDPYSNGTGALNENQGVLDARIGNANYDIGHVFTTGSGGVAGLAVPCGPSKARGTTGLPNPIGDPFAIDFVAHEMGHQWGGNHTFNGGTGNCAGGNRSAGSAYEPGSGITIMAYAGICGNQNLANNSIDTFHVKSLESIVQYSQSGAGNACAVTTASGNTPPVVTGPGNFNIPKLTPFALTASASDANGDSITYDWQQYDLGGATTAVPNSDSDGVARPIFRPFAPTASGTRTFPRLTHILNNANVPPNTTGGFLTGETLPTITRAMTFQVIARDNRPGTGGISTATSILTVDGNSGPFVITSPNTNVIFGTNTSQMISWNNANTHISPVNAVNVKISMSTDGGNTFPIILAASTANDGGETITMPGTPTTAGRIKIEAVGNVFFDISNANFTLTDGPTPTPTLTPMPTATPTATPSPCPAVFTENFDNVTAPGLPVGWTATNAVGTEPTWATSTTSPDTAPNAAFVADPPVLSDNRLESPNIAISGPSVLSFRNRFQTEADTEFWDGGVLEISSPNINGGTFTDITNVAVGGSFVTGGYTGTLFNEGPPNGNPLGGRMAWSGNSGGYINTVANLGPNVVGQTIKIRFRFGSDSLVGDIGWRVDTVSIRLGDCSGPTPTPTVAPSSTPTATPTNTPTATPTNTPTATPTNTPTATPTNTPTATPTPNQGNVAPFDYDGDGRSDLSVYRPSNGTWYMSGSTAGFVGVQFGVNSDKIVPTDYDGDGKADLAVYRPSEGAWYITNSSNGTFTTAQFGSATDLPAAGDYDGDNKADIAVFRPSEGTWYIANSSNGSFTIYQFGQAGDQPSLGDFDGDGRSDIAIFRPSVLQWYRVNSSDGSFSGQQFGEAGDRITPADFDGDGKSDIAVYRPSTGTWFIQNSTTGGFSAFVWGSANDLPAAGDFDGDGKANVAVFRPDGGFWYVLNSDLSFTTTQFGQIGDQPTHNAFN